MIWIVAIGCLFAGASLGFLGAAMLTVGKCDDLETDRIYAAQLLAEAERAIDNALNAFKQNPLTGDKTAWAVLAAYRRRREGVNRDQ